MFVFYETQKALEMNNNPYIGLILSIAVIIGIIGIVTGIIIYMKK